VAVADEFTIESRTVQESVAGYAMAMAISSPFSSYAAAGLCGLGLSSEIQGFRAGDDARGRGSHFAKCEARKTGMIDLVAALTHAHGRWTVPEWVAPFMSPC
jgi:hypothetical protein